MANLDFIPRGTVFTPEQITHWANPEQRSLDQAIAAADVLVTTPHSGAAIPEELAPFLSPALTRRLQYDYSDVATASIVRRWAQIDPRIVAVINPHPRLVRDPNRPKPDDVAATLAQAVERVRAAGAWQPVDLTGVDAIRPVTFSFFPILEIPESSAGVGDLVDTFARVAAQGLDVYQATNARLLDRFIEKTQQGRAEGADAHFTRLSFHDTMNTTTTRDGAVSVARQAKDRLPDVVALSNRGDHEARLRADQDPARPDDPPTMAAELMQALAHAHREGFTVTEPDAVMLNQPYLGSQEIRETGALLRERDLPPTAFGAVQAEFRREFLLGDRAVEKLHRPGTDWPAEDPLHVDAIAQACKRAWDLFRRMR